MPKKVQKEKWKVPNNTGSIIHSKMICTEFNKIFKNEWSTVFDNEIYSVRESKLMYWLNDIN